MLTKSIEPFQKPHYPLNGGHPNQLLTKRGTDMDNSTLSCPKRYSTSF